MYIQLTLEEQSKTRLHSTNVGRTHLFETDQQIKVVGVFADRRAGKILGSQLRNL